MSTHSVLTIRLVGGHSALDLLNTVDPDRLGQDRDVLRSFSDDVIWAMRAGVLSADDGEQLLELGRRSVMQAAQAHENLLVAREALRKIIRADVGNTPADPAAAGDFERTVAASQAFRHFCVTEKPFGWRWSKSDLDAVQHRIILSAADLLADGTRRPVSVCAGQNCDWYFLDLSKSGNRRWCSDGGCGTAARVRRLRHRRTAKG